MSKITFNSFFKIHKYRVSHKVLTLRSSIRKGDDFEHTDIIFGGAFYIQLPDYLENFVLRESDLKERGYVQRKYNKKMIIEQQVFVLEQGSKKYYVGAMSMRTQVSESADLGFDITL
jgi:hypothetical protein